MSDLSVSEEATSQTSSISRYKEWLDHRRLFFIVLTVAVLIYGQTEFWKRPVWSDSANWDYMAQVIARGGVPYRDAVNIKTPLSAYISAVAIIFARPFGLRDIFAIRLTYLFLAALTVAFTFLVAHLYFRSRRIALLAATIMLAFNLFAISNAGGTQPKTPMILFGLMALRAIKKDWPFRAGVFGMLSMLSWQSGLLFVGAAGLAFSRHLTRWRDGKAVKVVAGAGVPLLVLVLYFWAAGALRDFYLWCFHFNITVYAPYGFRSFSTLYAKLGRLINLRYSPETIYFYMAAAGLLIEIVREGRRAKANGMKSLLVAAPHHAMLIAPLVYFAFCMINIQGPPDIFPLLPFVSIFAAIAIVFPLDLTGSLIRRLKVRAHLSVYRAAGFILILGVIFFWSVADIFTIKIKRATLQEQDQVVAEMVAYLRPGDKIFVHGQTELLVLSGLTNASKYFFLDRGKDGYLDKIEPGGFNGWLERIRAERPKVIGLSRMDTTSQASKLVSLIQTDYIRRGTEDTVYYLRKH